jgi:hypothetical protein
MGESESGPGTPFRHHTFCRVHGSLRITPAMAAEITDHVWIIDELIAI